MERAQIVELIQGGVPPQDEGAGQVWAEFGAGTGNFTRALRQLLTRASTVYAVERDGDSLRRLREAVAREVSGAFISTVHAYYMQLFYTEKSV